MAPLFERARHPRGRGGRFRDVLAQLERKAGGQPSFLTVDRARAAAPRKLTVEQHFADAMNTVHSMGLASPAVLSPPKGDLTVDKAIGATLSSYPNLADWHLEGPKSDAKGKHWMVQVMLKSGEQHSIRVGEDGKVELAAPAGAKAPAKAPKAAPKPSGVYKPSDYADTGETNVVSHMSPGTVFYGSDQVHYKLHGNAWGGKTGKVKMAVIENLKTGHMKNTPYFTIHGKEYPIHKRKLSEATGRPDRAAKLETARVELAEATSGAEIVRLRARVKVLERLNEGALSSVARSKLPESAFALPGRRYPIHDRSHAANALARVSQHGTAEEKARVRAAVKRKYPDMGD